MEITRHIESAIRILVAAVLRAHQVAGTLAQVEAESLASGFHSLAALIVLITLVHVHQEA